MTIELVKSEALHFEGQIPGSDAHPWKAQDTDLCALPAGLYEVVFRRAKYSFAGDYGASTNNYVYTEEIAVGILVPTTQFTASRDPSVLKYTTRAYNLTMVPRKAELPCKAEYCIHYIPTNNIAYYTSFIVAVREITKGTPTYAKLVACLKARGSGATQTALLAAGLHV